MSSSKVRSSYPGSSVSLRRLGTTVVAGACATMLAGCANGFGAPTRHALANLQAAYAKVGTTLQLQGVIVALPDGASSPKGGLAYLVFTAINTADQPDELVDVNLSPTNDTAAPASASDGQASQAGQASVAGSVQAVGPTTIPQKAPNAPGVATIRLALRDLTAPLTQGESILVTLRFKNSGTAAGLFVPVQGSDAVGSAFLPSAPGSENGPSSPASSGSVAPSGSTSATASPTPSASAS